MPPICSTLLCRSTLRSLANPVDVTIIEVIDAVNMGYGRSGTGWFLFRQVRRHLGPTTVHLNLLMCSKALPSNGSMTKTSCK